MYDENVEVKVFILADTDKEFDDAVACATMVDQDFVEKHDPEMFTEDDIHRLEDYVAVNFINARQLDQIINDEGYEVGFIN